MNEKMIKDAMKTMVCEMDEMLLAKLAYIAADQDFDLAKSIVRDWKKYELVPAGLNVLSSLYLVREATTENQLDQESDRADDDAGTSH